MEEENVSKLISESFEKLSSQKTSNDITKRNILKELHKIILTNCHDGSHEKNLNNLLKNVVESLNIILFDRSERCREISLLILKDMTRLSFISNDVFPSIINAIAKRLRKTDEREQSEEIRLLHLALLYEIIEKYEGDLLPCTNDISSILAACIIDNCPDVKRRSCECLLVFASKKDSCFRMAASNFLKPLLIIISHQHLKTRTLCVKALGCIVNYLNNKEFQEALIHLAQRLFDRSPLVRIAVTEVIGNMLMNVDDRYSYFHLLIPLELSSLHDEVLEVRSKAEDIWKKVGNQYIVENEKDYKDLIDFPPPDPSDYPDKEIRPSVGCRIIVQRHLFNILPPLLHDMADWVPETRIKSSKVLYSLILHSEDKITMQLPKVLEGIMIAAKAEEREAAEQAMRCAELLGYFVDSNHLFDSLLNLIHKSPSAPHLSILAACIRGQKKDISKECLKAVCKFLSEVEVCRTREGDGQANLLLCVDALLFSVSKIGSVVSYDLFSILSSVSGLAVSDSILSKASELFQCLAELQACTKISLFEQHSMPLLKMISQNNELWTSVSPEVPIFSFIIESGFLDEKMLELIIPILINNLHHSKEAKVASIGDELLPIIATLSDDDEVATRLVTCKLLEITLPHLYGSIDDIKIHTACYEILRSLDDVSDDIRLMTVKVLKAYIESFPTDYNWSLYRSYLKHLFENVLIHMDDKNEKMRQNIFDLLKTTAFVAPDVLLQEIEAKRYLMSTSDLCDTLTEHIKNMKL
ncbi:dynein axonemal assembly factor 5-like isoform X2 [Argiope bruennichi]|uniref:dynein axonemal assembly factor 5-like isoform X2 n=1 Tax=Argiope bruennichi TaxID=94029 RepID=UPI002494B1FD|nr:dynein axonemal assembly factor 5-like isoform X2 [Argiope bruennichi]